MTDIDDKYQLLGGAAGVLGGPVASETATSDGNGFVRMYERGAIFQRSGLQPVAVLEPIYGKYAALSAEAGPLGYPRDDETTTDGVRRSRFAYGDISYEAERVPFSIYAQNTALIGADQIPSNPFGLGDLYKGVDREEALFALIGHLKSGPADVVGLSEVFFNNERALIKRELKDIYPHTHEGPDEFDVFEESGALLLLSKYPVVARGEMIYRHSTGADSLANKGVLFARVEPDGAVSPYDVFLSHTQNEEENARAPVVLLRQLTALGEYIRAVRSVDNPTFLLGDLNVDGTQDHVLTNMNDRLDHDEDLFLVAGCQLPAGQPPGTIPRGITYDDMGTFQADRPERWVEAPERHQTGRRLDYILQWFGRERRARFEPMEIVVIPTTPCQSDATRFCRHVSDHYGIQIQQHGIERVAVNLEKIPPIKKLTAKFIGWRCIEQTSGGLGRDDVIMRFELETRNQPIAVWEQQYEVQSGDGYLHQYFQAPTLTLERPNGPVTVTVFGKDVDGVTGDDHFGPAKVQLSREDLVLLYSQGERRVEMPLMQRSGAKYTADVRLSVEWDR